MAGNDEAFLQGLRDLGYVEGRNLVIEYRSMPRGSPSGSPLSRPSWSALKVDVIVTTATPAARAAKQATTTIPIVFAGGAIPSTRGSSPASRGQAVMSRG